MFVLYIFDSVAYRCGLPPSRCSPDCQDSLQPTLIKCTVMVELCRRGGPRPEFHQSGASPPRYLAFRENKPCFRFHHHASPGSLLNERHPEIRQDERFGSVGGGVVGVLSARFDKRLFQLRQGASWRVSQDHTILFEPPKPRRFEWRLLRHLGHLGNMFPLGCSEGPVSEVGIEEYAMFRVSTDPTMGQESMSLHVHIYHTIPRCSTIMALPLSCSALVSLPVHNHLFSSKPLHSFPCFCHLH